MLVLESSFIVLANILNWSLTKLNNVEKFYAISVSVNSPAICSFSIVSFLNEVFPSVSLISFILDSTLSVSIGSLTGSLVLAVNLDDTALAIASISTSEDVISSVLFFYRVTLAENNLDKLSLMILANASLLLDCSSC